MKISIIYVALLTVISVEAAAVASQDECYAAGGPCNTLKRAAEAAAEAMAEASPDPKELGPHQCMGRGDICFKTKRDFCGTMCIKAKRDALALAEAVAEAAPYANPNHHQCSSRSGICYMAKRNAMVVAEALADIQIEADTSDANIENIAEEETCHEIGGPCESVKRAAKAAAEAMAEASPDPREPGPHQCMGRGGICYKAKRALEGLNDIVNGIL